jgi:hypothetical protein
VFPERETALPQMPGPATGPVKHLGHEQTKGGPAPTAGMGRIEQGDLMATSLQIPGRRATDDATADDGDLARAGAQICFRSSWT